MVREQAPWREWTLVHLLRRQAAEQDHRPFVRFEHGPAFTFRALDAWTDELAGSLAALGVRPGDRVLGLIGNRAESIGMLFATVKLGAVWVPVNTGLRGAFLQHQLHNAEPRVVVLEDRLAVNFSEVAPGSVVPEALVIVGEAATPTPPCLAAARRLALSDLRALRAPADLELVTPVPGDVAMIMYTSGTTGPSKGVLIPHGHCYLAGLGLAEATALTAADRYFVCMPLFHANALLMQFVGSLIAGAQVAVTERFRATSWLEEVRAAEATITNGLGVIPEFIFRQPPTDRDRDHRLRLMMAVPIAPEWGAAFERRFGVPFMQGFGMTECNIVAYTRPGDVLVPGCAGYPLAEWFEVGIADPDTDAVLPVGQTGEIVVRPKLPGCVMAGYFRMPEKTVEAWRNLWFHTGDAGRFDDAGRLHYVDRIKDCIRRRGENISSFEIEQVLNAHPAVAESAVVGIKVAGAGGEDEVKAYVVPAAGAVVDPVKLLDWCVPRMPHFAVPRFVEVVAGELAKTPTGKLQKTPLRDAGITPTTWDRESIGYVVRR
ncbi:MAG TPA: AMP-binding protein [Candidatus Nitrosotalea sp.]|nr:AMP-binding protein [Candidatus Nitrosotalea sp.]